MRTQWSLTWLTVGLVACASPSSSDRSADAGIRNSPQESPTSEDTRSILRSRDLTLRIGKQTNVELVDAAFTLGASELTVRGSKETTSFGDRAALLDGSQAGEHFRVREDQLEQYWTFAQEPEGDADVVIRVPVSGLAYVGDSSEGLTFRASTGQHVSYSHAKFRDAASHATHVPVRFVNGAIEMVLSRNLLSTSAYPAELDPIIKSSVLNLAVDVWSAPSIAYSAALNQFGVTYVSGTTAEASVEAIRLDSSGAPVDSVPFKLFTTTSLGAPETAATATGFATVVHAPSGTSGSGTSLCMTWTSDSAVGATRLAEISFPFAVEPGTGSVLGYASAHSFSGSSKPGIVRAQCGSSTLPTGLVQLGDNEQPYSLMLGAGVLAYWKLNALVRTTNTSAIAVNTLNLSVSDLAIVSANNRRFLFYANSKAIKAMRLDDAAKPVGAVFEFAGPSDNFFGPGLDAVFDGRDIVIAARLGANLVFRRVTPELVAIDPGWKALAWINGDAELGFELASDGKGRTVVAYAARRTTGATGLVSAVMLDRDAVGGASNGTSCASGLECESGNCVDGFCCNTSCGFGQSSDCQTCSLAAGATSNGTCTFLPAQVECQPSKGVCDPAEFCTGTSGECPSDKKREKGFVCGAEASGPCDVNDVCDGVTAECRTDAREPSTKICRAATDACDAPELCNGKDTSCPDDRFLGPHATCRAAAGSCDRAEQCTGTGKACPPDTFEPSSKLCRAAEDLCDADEYCTGSSVTCGDDHVEPAGTECRPKNGECDAPDVCDGTSKACALAVAPAGTLCRDANGPCDVADFCTGTDTTCPSSFASAETVCRPAKGVCDKSEVCPGDAADCPKDAFADKQVVCRASAGPCDVPEQCDGAGGCPADAFAPATQVCRAQQGVCDFADTCSGVGASCTSDRLQPAGRVCAVNGDVCGACDGMTITCGEDRSEALCRGPASPGTNGDNGCSVRVGNRSARHVELYWLLLLALMRRALRRKTHNPPTALKS